MSRKLDSPKDIEEFLSWWKSEYDKKINAFLAAEEENLTLRTSEADDKASEKLDEMLKFIAGVGVDVPEGWHLLDPYRQKE